MSCLVAFHYRSYGTFFLHKIGSIISIVDLPTTNIIEPFKKVLAMTGTNTFTVLSTEDLEQTSGGLAVWEDGYSRWLYYREFAPYMRQGALNSYIDAWKYGFRAG